MADTAIMVAFKHAVAANEALEAVGKIGKVAKGYLNGECWLCTEKMKSSKLKEHVISVHGVTECFLCNDELENIDLRAHVLKHRLIHCPYCDTSVDFDEIVMHVKSHSNDERFVHCPDCGDSVLFEAIVDHVKSHSDDRLLPCPDCQQMIGVDTIIDHVKSHSVEKCCMAWSGAGCSSMRGRRKGNSKGKGESYGGEELVKG